MAVGDTGITQLLGRRCIITGASRGLGAAIATRFWSEGADLLLVARSRDALACLRDNLERRHDQRVHLFTCDLASVEAPARIADEAQRCFGGLSVLVNNAALQGPIGPLWENDWAEWERTLRVNLLAVVDLCRRCVPLLGSPGSKIINISGGGATGPRAMFSAYSTAKAGLVRFSETLAHEVAPLGIDVNCVAPGAMNSAMTEAILATDPARAGEREYADALRVHGQGPEVAEGAADLCVFLASSASDRITGRLISAVWDPWLELPRLREELGNSDIYTLRRIVPRDRGLNWVRG
jgi:NAD(P)-dependent dehydrogenase (short-subunit alcohol dehydrogenase family)